MIEAVIDCQQRLIAALDAQDVDAIEYATSALQIAVERLRLQRTSTNAGQISHALNQSDAARIRVKYLSAWNRQKIDRLQEYRGQSSAMTYARPQEI